MRPRSALHRDLELRAQSRCEYCRMHQSLQGASFHVEHVVPKSKGGNSDIENLAWACPTCNLHKADRTLVIDPGSGETVSLFNPRSEAWTAHFEWEDYSVVGLSSVGRATVAVLDLNNARRIKIRKAEQLFALFPPEEDVATKS